MATRTLDRVLVSARVSKLATGLHDDICRSVAVEIIETGNVGYREVRQEGLGISQSVDVSYRSCYRDVGQHFDICRSVAVEIVTVHKCNSSDPGM